jgi:hypothetical protein
MILRNRDTVAILWEKMELPMVAARKRVKKYRSEGGAADLVRVEVLVPPAARNEILAMASRLRADHRGTKELRSLYENALKSYRVRILDNVDLDRLPDLRARGSGRARHDRPGRCPCLCHRPEDARSSGRIGR